MSVIILILLFLIIYKCKIRLKDGYFKDYLSSNNTLPIKGIFVLIIFFSHSKNYIVLNSIIDKPMLLLNNWLGQSIVAMFLFYSGYGIYEQIKKRKEKYIEEFPKKRLLKTWVNFAIAVMSFLIMDIILGRIANYSISTILLSFIGWETIGNSNWFMFLTFLLYIFIIISFKLFNKNNLKAIILTLLLLVMYVIIIRYFKPAWWWNTAFCLPFGMIYSFFKEKIDCYMLSDIKYYFTTIFIIVLYIILNLCYMKLHLTFLYPIVTGLFCIVIVFITMKFQINSKILSFLGKYTFWIYILQRIPMIILSQMGLNKYKYVFVILCFIITIGLSYIYSLIFDKKILIIKRK